ncbi:uncharacterized protein MEPE_04378 [Melanopsichium pennsylvanicum]|uniref:Uncharacterized protein n=2 Tax=Melanopsichium pennsylvanicum TaxID=63383 RepID=A0AAJ4XNM9_9BASI|nr:hypothetical protein BN887_06178 [Melanopsichium pennsylvanicum 4]SNX85669.1 uncharacterized protein MEPE_04378 [Melanopsichium pennsylvanicum]
MQTSALQSAASPSKPKSKFSHDLVGVFVILVEPCTPRAQLCYDKLQRLRQKYDQAYRRWLPHITLIPPFILNGRNGQIDESLTSRRLRLERLIQLHEQKLSQIAQAARQACAGHESHSLLLDQVSAFSLPKYANIHLRPFPTNFEDKTTRQKAAASLKEKQGEFEPSAAESVEDTSSRRIVELQKALQDAVQPLLRTLKRNPRRQQSDASDEQRNAFKPHVSVGQAKTSRATWVLNADAKKVLKVKGNNRVSQERIEFGMLCKVDKVQLMVKERGSESPYQVHLELPLSK